MEAATKLLRAESIQQLNMNSLAAAAAQSKKAAEQVEKITKTYNNEISSPKPKHRTGQPETLETPTWWHEQIRKQVNARS